VRKEGEERGRGRSRSEKSWKEIERVSEKLKEKEMGKKCC